MGGAPDLHGGQVVQGHFLRRHREQGHRDPARGAARPCLRSARHRAQERRWERLAGGHEGGAAAKPEDEPQVLARWDAAALHMPVLGDMRGSGVPSKVTL
jgi:hypothetical protein